MNKKMKKKMRRKYSSFHYHYEIREMRKKNKKNPADA